MTDLNELDDSFFNRDALLGHHEELAQELDKPTPHFLMRFSGASLLIGIAVIHYLGFSETLEKTPYLGYSYIAVIVASLMIAVVLLCSRSIFAWQAAVTIAAATLLAYVISRTTGLPDAKDNIGDWTNLFGIIGLVLEGSLILLGFAAAKAKSRD